MSTHTGHPILLCCDLDRTLIPNGKQPESPDARKRLARVCQHPEVHLTLISGRDLGLVLSGIDEWQLPIPEFIIGDVGTTIYTPGASPPSLNPNDWISWPAWTAEIAPDWSGMTHDDITDLFKDLTALTPQEREKQGLFKASYYVDLAANQDILEAELQRRLWRLGINARLIWSFDEMASVGLLDVLPINASKLHAMEFLIHQQGYSVDRTLFAGDSGNDLHALTSQINAVLVANAEEEVKTKAIETVRAAGLSDTLYVAQGDFLGMNGNYAAGVLEGLAHYLPETCAWMELNSAST